MKKLSILLVPCFVSSFGLAISACGGDGKPGPQPPVTTAEPTAAATEAPAAAPTAAPTTDPSVAPAVDKPTRKPSGRPATTFESSTGLEGKTCGSTPGSVLKLTVKSSTEPLVLSLPEFSLPGAYNITWKEAPKGQSKKPLLGPVVQLIVQEAGKPDPVRVDSDGVPFEVRMPLWGKDSVNLAVGDIKLADSGKETVTWTIYAPKLADKALGNATFELSAVGWSYVHATTAAPTAGAAPEAGKAQ